MALLATEGRGGGQRASLRISDSCSCRFGTEVCEGAACFHSPSLTRVVSSSHASSSSCRQEISWAPLTRASMLSCAACIGGKQQAAATGLSSRQRMV